MQYLFILGRNLELSEAEIFSYLKKEGIFIKEHKKIDNALLIETDKELDKNTINKLGGTIAIGEVICKVDEKELGKINIYTGTNNKLNYVIWNFSKHSSYNKLSDYLKKRFRGESLKATQRNLTGNLKIQNGKEVRISSGLIDEEYFVFEDKFGKVIEKCDYKTLEERDMEKIVRRSELAISPRLAKIMINLSEIKKNQILLDPFCGIGIILTEALIQGINVIGIDKDKNAIEGAKKNLKQLDIKKYELINADSMHVKIKQVDSLVTEPELGILVKKIPNEEETRNILTKYESLMISVLNNLKNSVNGRFVFTAPFILTNNKKRFSVNIENILRKIDLKLISRFQEYREEQIVGREIFVMEK